MPKKAFRDMGFSKNDFIKLTNSMLNLDFSESIKTISFPVLVICGKKDSTNKKSAKYLAENIPQANIQFITNSRHEVNIDEPEKLAQSINGFYK